MMGLGFGGFMMGGGVALYHLFCFITLLGVAFLLIWIARFGTKGDIMKWAKWLIIVGVVGGILSLLISMAGFRLSGGDFNSNYRYFPMMRGYYNSQFLDVNEVPVQK